MFGVAEHRIGLIAVHQQRRPHRCAGPGRQPSDSSPPAVARCEGRIGERVSATVSQSQSHIFNGLCSTRDQQFIQHLPDCRLRHFAFFPPPVWPQ